MRKYVIGGNWKLQHNQVSATKRILEEMVNENQKIKEIGQLEIFLALPFTTLFVGNEILSGSNIKLAAQNVYYKEKGPFTGEVSIEALKDLNVEYILIGHSERRIIFNETDEDINLKIKKVLEYNIIPVLCIGETAFERNIGKMKEVLTKQLEKGLKNLSTEQIKLLLIAYEPVWAINNPFLNPTGKITPATPSEAKVSHKIIREWMVSHHGISLANDVRILYGGSMDPKNAEKLLKLGEIDGGLIGGASLNSKAFSQIQKIALKIHQANID